MTAQNIEFTFFLNLSCLKDEYLGKQDENLTGHLLEGWLGKALHEPETGRVINFLKRRHITALAKNLNQLKNLEVEKRYSKNNWKKGRLIYQLNRLEPGNQEDKQNSKDA